MLSFSLVAEALTGLIYHRPSGENSKFATKNFLKNHLRYVIMNKMGQLTGENMNAVAEIRPYIFLGGSWSRSKEFVEAKGITLIINGKKVHLLYVYRL